MYIVIGATGHIGSQVVQELKNSGEKIIAVAHSDDGAKAIGDDDLVNGVAVVKNGTQTDARPGQVIANSLVERK